MAYDEKRCVKAQIKPSPSMIYSNLTAAGPLLWYSHLAQACIVAPETIKAGTPSVVKQVVSQPQDVIHSVRACTHNDTTYVVLATEAGIQIYDAIGSSQQFSWSFPELQPSSAHTTFARGVAIVVTADGSANIVFGCSSGEVYALEVQQGAAFGTPQAVGRCGTVPITAAGSAYQSCLGSWTADLGSEVVVGDETGSISVWKGQSTGRYSQSHTIPPTVEGPGSSPTVALAVRRDLIVAGRLDGTVQVLGLHDGQLSASFTAHSRWLSGMDLHPRKDTVATVAEDGSLAVWHLPLAGKKAVCQLSTVVMNAALSGVAFCGPSHDDVAVVAFDYDEINIFKAG